MEQTIVMEAQRILKEPPEREKIPIQRAANALNKSLTEGTYLPEYHFVKFLDRGRKTNLYFTYPSTAARDENGNYDSPIFQDSHYNNIPPLWQLFREQLEKKWNTKITRVIYGDYREESDGEAFFKVKEEPAQGGWLYVEKPDGSFSIGQLNAYQINVHQSIFDGLRTKRAYRIATMRADHESSKKCKQDGIAYLKKHYPDYFDRFTFDSDETFRFRQFSTEFLYTPEGLSYFDEFYLRVAEPYRQDEEAKEAWKETSKNIKERILNDAELASGLKRENGDDFKFNRLEDGSCEVTSDLIDDDTSREFSIRVPSQDPDVIFNEVTAKLRVILQRKEQARRAISTLYSLASRKA